jgi:integrase
MGRGTGVRAATKTSIQISFEYQGVQCRERLRIKPTPENLKYAQRMKGTIEQEIAFGSFDYGKHFPESRHALKFSRDPSRLMLVGKLLTDWLAAARLRLEPETYTDYAEYVENVWRPTFGKLRLCDLTAALVQEWINSYPAGEKRILNLLTPLREALRYAVHPLKLLTLYPLEGLVVSRPTPIRAKKIDPFTFDEIQRILAVLEPPFANMVEFWVWTGLRMGEVIALLWADADLEAGFAHVKQAARGKRRKAPKTAAGNREVTLLPPALEALKRQKAHTRLLHKEIFLHPGTLISYKCDGKVVHTGRRRPTTVNRPFGNDKAIRNFWRPALIAAGVRYRPPKQLRHTYASWMLMRREDPQWVAKQLGHEDVSITLKRYVKYIPSMNPNPGIAAYHAIMAAAKKGTP